ncbi:MAG: hypothetical protein E7168_01175 [Firmicutes bacterium]|nr:hypothetical protein [Bacillota bacterium]
MNNCIHLKQKFNNKLECKKTNKIININDCKNCPYKEYKKCTTIVKKSTYNRTNAQKSPLYCAKMKQRSSKLAKLERDRFSLFTDDLEHCIICGKKKDHINEVFPGAFRQRSIKEHMVLPLCSSHHRQIHNDTELSLYWKRSCQKLFEKSRTRDEFIKIFGRSYL